ncbi:MAG: ABC transporter permease [Bryobacteraceae bacterium]|nr:ABC transporter permease [Bryobacteraceae bacterium]
MHLGEALRFSINALNANKFRTFLTALGLVIGNASIILVVTISLTSRDYILEQISGIGSNLVFAYLEVGYRDAATVDADFIKIADVEAVRRQLGPRIQAASGVMQAYDSVVVAGRPKDVVILGTDEYYARVRNLVQLAGRPLDSSDVSLRHRVALLTERLAQQMFGSTANAVGKTMKLFGLQFTVIGVFREKTESFGLSELARETVLIPITVMRYFTPQERVDPMYVQATGPNEVEAVTRGVREVLESRHRAGASYYVGNLSAILDAAKNIALILTIVLILIAAIAMVISGIGIMNIMLVTVTERTREIGVRRAVGATPRDVQHQFLMEAVLISVSGGLVGVLCGAAIPLSVGFFTDAIQIQFSWLSVFVAFGVSLVVGVIFGLLPANRAARLNPTEALRYE